MLLCPEDTVALDHRDAVRVKLQYPVKDEMIVHPEKHDVPLSRVAVGQVFRAGRLHAFQHDKIHLAHDEGQHACPFHGNRHFLAFAQQCDDIPEKSFVVDGHFFHFEPL